MQYPQNKISIVILTYNRSTLLKDLLLSLQKLRYEPLEIIVIDNYSEDNTEEMIGSAFPNIGYIRTNKNIGVSARNLGLKRATGDIVVTLDDDIIGLDDIGWVLHNSHLIIGRSGANISQEIVQLKKSAILIPLPQSQQNEQLKNAVWVKQHLPQTIIIDQKQLSPSLLLKNIQEQSTGNHTSQNRSIKAVENLQIITLIHQLV